MPAIDRGLSLGVIATVFGGSSGEAAPFLGYITRCCQYERLVSPKLSSRLASVLFAFRNEGDECA